MEPTERKTMETRGNKHALNIKHVQASDFGNYSCVAENSLGRAKKYMELSGESKAEYIRKYFCAPPGPHVAHIGLQVDHSVIL